MREHASLKAPTRPAAPSHAHDAAHVAINAWRGSKIFTLEQPLAEGETVPGVAAGFP